jgi:hypothetical protein
MSSGSRACGKAGPRPGPECYGLLTSSVTADKSPKRQLRRISRADHFLAVVSAPPPFDAGVQTGAESTFFPVLIMLALSVRRVGARILGVVHRFDRKPMSEISVGENSRDGRLRWRPRKRTYGQQSWTPEIPTRSLGRRRQRLIISQRPNSVLDAVGDLTNLLLVDNAGGDRIRVSPRARTMTPFSKQWFATARAR